MPRLKTVFMGSDPIVLPLLAAVLASPEMELCVVFAQPDRPHGRGMKMMENPVKAWAAAHGIAVRQPEKPTADDAAFLRETGCDLLLVMAYGHLLKNDILSAPRLPPLNFHASLLPELRGASPIETAIATGRSETGVSLMKIVKKMDAGAVADVEKVPVSPDDDRASLAEKLGAACPKLLARALPKLLGGGLDFAEQDESKVSFCRIMDKDDSNLDFSASASELACRSRALKVWPGTAFDYAGSRIRIGAALALDETTGAAPGTVLAARKTLDIATGNGTFRILSMQRPGGKMLPTHEFLNGLKIAPGELLASRPMAPLERRQ
ncbi:MAG TPA: methionyl-tRNA formyltransferase [Opitutales bacterium]|nr:methionyl-tRNA formyltransferase [Opitutales bacterium]